MNTFFFLFFLPIDRMYLAYTFDCVPLIAFEISFSNPSIGEGRSFTSKILLHMRDYFCHLAFRIDVNKN